MNEHIVLTGVESTYKSTLAKALSLHFGFPVVEEYARMYLEELGTLPDMSTFPLEHFEQIKSGQLQAMRDAGYYDSSRPTTLFDTDGLTLHVWAVDKFNLDLKELTAHNAPVFYLLCVPTNAPNEDPQRVDAHRREELHGHYEKLLQDKSYALLDATSYQERLAQAITILEQRGFKPLD